MDEKHLLKLGALLALQFEVVKTMNDHTPQERALALTALTRATGIIFFHIVPDPALAKDLIISTINAVVEGDKPFPPEFVDMMYQLYNENMQKLEVAEAQKKS